MESSREAVYTQNRELSWLRFNDSVLSEAMDESVPLLERLKFISIFTSNLDEFFMIRVGSLHDLETLGSSAVDKKSGMTATQQLQAIYQAVGPLYEKRERVFRDVEQQLRLHGSTSSPSGSWEQRTRSICAATLMKTWRLSCRPRSSTPTTPSPTCKTRSSM